MNFSRRLILQLVLLGIWLGACYGVRFALMENPHWVAVCDGETFNAVCSLRSAMGVTIHFQILAWIALLLALSAFFIREKNGNKLAWIALIFAAPALALYTVALAVFAALISGLRLVRDERHNDAANNADAAAHPNA
ncbi:MAG TPA: hypothetical protein VGK97_10825 [Spongiibacteraceae bacterium]